MALSSDGLKALAERAKDCVAWHRGTGDMPALTTEEYAEWMALIGAIPGLVDEVIAARGLAAVAADPTSGEPNYVEPEG